MTFKNFFRDFHQNDKQFGSRSGQTVWPDLCPYCLQRFTADDKSHKLKHIFADNTHIIKKIDLIHCACNHVFYKSTMTADRISEIYDFNAFNSAICIINSKMDF